jgi:hypothetical protein
VKGDITPRTKSVLSADDTRHGFTMGLPAGWHRAGRNLTPHLLDPHEILSVATYRLRYRRRVEVWDPRLSDAGAQRVSGHRHPRVNPGA